MRIAAQLYTLRDYTTTGKGFREALKKCAEIGYAGVQLSAVRCMDGDEPEVDAETARKWLDELGLLCCATHRPWASLVNQTDAEIQFHKTLGCDYTAIGGIGGDFGIEAESYARFLGEGRPVAERLGAAGLRFGYHNHSHEFIRNPKSGRPCIELLTHASESWLQMEVDTYWVAHAGVCPAAFLSKIQPGRLAAVHLKDMEVVAQEGPVMAPVGEGNLDWDEILAVCKAAGTEWLIVEQDTYRRDPFDCLASSFEFLAIRA